MLVSGDPVVTGYSSFSSHLHMHSRDWRVQLDAGEI